MTVVVLTCSDDVWVPDVVVAAVERAGGRAVRVDSDLFPGRHTLGVDDDGRWRLGVVGGGTSSDVDVVEVGAVWARRRWPGLLPIVDERFQQACAAQGRALLHAWLRDLGAHVVNGVDAEDQAEDKVLQLKVARALGFVVPETLVTNEPARARDFIDDVRRRGGQVVTKLLVPLVQRMQGGGDFFYTARVDDDDRAALAGLVHAPQIFQREIHKRLELRVQVVGDDVFCGALPALARDWRLQTSGTWQEHALSAATRARCLRLCRGLGLVTGAIDLVVDEDGQEHFLEVNPAGEWGFLQAELGFPIAAALARELLRVE